MRKKDFIRIINEEVAEFDFLGNQQHLKEQGTVELLSDEQFQKQFIIDSITRMREKIDADNSDASVRNEPDVEDSNIHDDMTIEINTAISYRPNPNQEPVKFGISFNGDRISYYTSYESERRTYDYPGSFDAWYDQIEWGDIDVTLYSQEGDDVEFTAFEKAPPQIQELFIRTYVEPMIEQHTDLGDVREKLPSYKPF